MNSSRRRVNRVRLAVETLEPRQLLAQFAPVPYAVDGAAGSLRAAITAANLNNEDDVITLSAGVYPIKFQNPGQQENNNATGDFDLNEAQRVVTIQGQGASTVIDGRGLDRVFQVGANVTLILSNLSIVNGLASDNGVAGAAPNTSDAVGGGILAAGGSKITLNNVQLSNNQALGTGSSSAINAQGGAIASQGELVLNKSLIYANKATGSAAGRAQGGGIYTSGRITLTDSSLINNQAIGGAQSGSGSGGGLYLATGGTLQGTGVIIDSNSAQGASGQNGVAVGTINVKGNPGAPGAAGQGGGLYLAGTATLAGRISNNTAQGGDGGNGSLQQFGSGGNGGAAGAALGGGIYLAGGSSLSLNKANIVNNSALGGTGGNGGDAGLTAGIAGEGGPAQGGGIFVADSSVTTNVTMADSSVDNNQTSGGFGGNGGSGIANGNGGSGGAAGTGRGGGLSLGGGANLKAYRSTIANNRVENNSGGQGGNGVNFSGFGGNGATARGGGISLYGALSSATLINVTVSQNTVQGGNGGAAGSHVDPDLPGSAGGAAGNSLGAGIDLDASTTALTLQNSTVTGNLALTSFGGAGDPNGTPIGSNGANGSSFGGGLFQTDTTSQLNMVSSIIGGNSSNISPDVFGTFNSVSYSLVESSVGTTGITDGANGNVVGKSPLLSGLTDNGDGPKTHSPLPGSPVINKGRNPTGQALDARRFPRVSGAAAEMGAVELQAAKVALGGTTTYVENAPRLLLATSATVTDLDSFNFDGGQLVVTITVNAKTADRLEIPSQGTGPGQIGVSGTNVSYEGVVIGVMSGGLGSTPLKIAFNSSSATPVAVQALVRAITYRSASDNPPTAQRTITFVLDDGDGTTSNPATATKLVKVVAVNDAPTLTGGGSSTFTLGSAPLAFASTATAADLDNANFNLGKLTVQYTSGAQSADTLAFTSVVTIDASNNITVGGVVIGTRTKTGTNGADLEILLNTNATVGLTQTLLQALTFKATATPGKRVLSITLTDTAQALSNALTSNITVQ